jgi:prepilin-type N-terminal cleavage/methylation domain-containing protein
MNKNRGFTIVELLVVIVVIGVLAAITIVSFTGISQRAVVAAIQSDLSNASKQLKIYNTTYGSYPTMDNNKCPSAPNVDTKYCLKASGSNSYTVYWSISSGGQQNFCVEVTNGTNIYYISDSSAPTQGQNCRWITGLTSTPLAGKYVYYQDSPTNLTWMSSAASCPAANDGSQPCKVGLDTTYPSNAVLLSPQAYPSLDFSGYPAQNFCKGIGGRLPNMQELSSMLSTVNRVSYGNNFPKPEYWSSVDGGTFWAWVYRGDGLSTWQDIKTITGVYARCIKD